MANKTVRLFSGDLAGETGLTLELINPDTGAIGNGAGDALTEVANGLFETTVTEAITGWWKATVKKATVIYASGGNLYIASDVVGEYLVDDPALVAMPTDLNVNITPLAATDIQRVVGTTITVFLKENITIGPIAVTDVNNDNVDLSAPCELIISQKYRGDVIVIADGSITRSGVDNHQFSFSSSGATLIPGTFAWSLRRVSDNYVFAHGDWIVKQTAVKD